MARATSVFEKQAATYRGPREKLIPQMERFYGMVPEAIGLAEPETGREGQPLRILDLGAGTGMLSAVVAEAWPDAAFTLFDFSPRMLEQAKESLGEAVRVLTNEGPDRIRELLALSSSRNVASVKRKAEAKLADVDKRLAELQRVREGLSSLVAACPGHGMPERCPILKALGGEES